MYAAYCTIIYMYGLDFISLHSLLLACRLKSDFSRRSPDARGCTATTDFSSSERRNSVDPLSSHSRSSYDAMERARSRSPLRNGPVTSHAQDISNRTTPLIRTSSTSSSDVKIVEDPRGASKDDAVAMCGGSGDHHRHRLSTTTLPLSHDVKLNGYKPDLLLGKPHAQSAMSRLVDYLSPPHLASSSPLDRHRLFPSLLGLERPPLLGPGLWTGGGGVEVEQRQRDLDRQLGRWSALERESLIDYERKALGGGGGSLRPPLDAYSSSAAVAVARGLVLNHHLQHSASPQHLHHSLSVASSLNNTSSKTSSVVSAHNRAAPPPLIPNSSNNHVTASSTGAHLMRQHSMSPSILKAKSASPLVSNGLNSSSKISTLRPANGPVSDTGGSR